MADVVVTVASVRAPASARLTNGIVGEDVTAGALLYYKVADLKWWLADCLTLEKAGGLDPNYLKIAMSGALTGQVVSLLNPGQIMTMNAGLTKGIYLVSKTANGGKLMPVSDLVSTNILAEAGYAISTTEFYFSPVKSGVVV